METIFEKLYKLGLIKHRIILSDPKQKERVSEDFIMSSGINKLNQNSFNIKNIISRYHSEEAYNFISSFADMDLASTQIFSTNDNFNIEKIPDKTCNILINLRKINDIRRINKFFELANDKLPLSGLFIGCSETLELRRERLMNKYPFIINRFMLVIDFAFKRVMPKLWLTKKIYFFLTAGRNRIISRAETLGRLYSCGFIVVAETTIGYLNYFVVRKTENPAYDLSPSYGMFFPMVRTGKNGKIIRVYKFRTMFPFSEYLQEYIYHKNKLDVGGKFKNDFRITGIGKFMRKFWLDELPMIFNLFRGELKLVGIRPLSKQFQSLYPDDLSELRKKVKPGLVPPYYADMPNGLEEIFESEWNYLIEYQKAPFRTDWKYFWKAIVNIIFRSARSK